MKILLPLLTFVLLSVSVPVARGETPFTSVRCEGIYKHHLQGVCTNETDAIYWSFTTQLVKTDVHGKVIRKIPVENHHGDLCHRDGKIYVAVNFGRFNDPEGKADCWVYVYDATDLALLSKHKTPEVFHGAGGIAWQDKRFVVVGGLPASVEVNYVYEYDSAFRFVKKHEIKSGQTLLGIQTAAFHDGHWWFGCYGNPKILLQTDAQFGQVKRFEQDASLGVVGIGRGQFLVARGGGSGEQRSGAVFTARPDKEKGLVADNSAPTATNN